MQQNACGRNSTNDMVHEQVENARFRALQVQGLAAGTEPIVFHVSLKEKNS
jgi:hypothetical protein